MDNLKTQNIHSDNGPYPPLELLCTTKFKGIGIYNDTLGWIDFSIPGILDDCFQTDGLNIVDFIILDLKSFLIAYYPPGNYKDINLGIFTLRNGLANEIDLTPKNVIDVYYGDLSKSYSSVIANPYYNCIAQCTFKTNKLIMYADTLGLDVEENMTNNDVKINYFSIQNILDISINLEVAENMKINLLNYLGQEIACLKNEEISNGNSQYQLDLSQYKLTSGVYFCNIIIGSYSVSKKILIMK